MPKGSACILVLAIGAAATAGCPVNPSDHRSGALRARQSAVR